MQKKEVYEPLRIQLLYLLKEDIVTLSEPDKEGVGEDIFDD